MDKNFNLPKELRGQYMLDALNCITRCGDAYVSTEQLYKACQRHKKALCWDSFKVDKAFLLREGYLRQEGQRLYSARTWRYESASAEELANILSHNYLKDPPYLKSWSWAVSPSTQSKR